MACGKDGARGALGRPRRDLRLVGVVWLVLAAGYAAQGWQQMLADLRDPVQGAFVPAPITGMILSAALAARCVSGLALRRNGFSER